MGSQWPFWRARRPVAPPTAGLHAVDVSNFTGALSEHTLMTWRLQHDIGRVIVQAVAPPPGYPPTVTRQQIEACAAAGMPVDVYLYLWTRGDQRADMLSKLALLNGLEQHVGRLWLDVEDTAGATVLGRLTSIRVALAVLDGWSTIHGKPLPGIYTGRWWWTAYLGDSPLFASRLLWCSDYDGVDDPDVFRPFGGWQSCAIKQFRGTSTLAGVGGVDLNIMRKGV